MRAKFISEFLGTTFLLMIIIGSGIMGENLSQGNKAIALLANSLATGAGLFVLICTLGSISGAHFNPAVSLIERFWNRMTTREMFYYWTAQFSGAILGVLLIHLMFELPLFQESQNSRNSWNLGFSEFIATFGLISVIALAGLKRVEWAPVVIAAYITSAYWFTSSTSFANPAVTLARSWTNTFSGIAPDGVLLFCAFQVLGALTAFITLKSFLR